MTVRPELREQDAPAQLILPDVLTGALQSAWTQALYGPRVREQGGNLVRNRDGSLAYLFLAEKSAESGDFTLAAAAARAAAPAVNYFRP